ncbi:MAG: hypothetical protein QHH00_08450, partial [Methanomassiliicoccales archaeon]|nr:hypothetical protein [Methanomassiliicoccales archaeon]
MFQVERLPAGCGLDDFESSIFKRFYTSTAARITGGGSGASELDRLLPVQGGAGRLEDSAAG